MDQAFDRAFGRRLREMRTEKKILQSAFAELCGISPAYLSDIERGKRNPPGREVILAWAKLLDADLAEEIGRELLDLAAVDKGLLEKAEPGREPVMEVEPIVAGRSTTPSSAGNANGNTHTRFLNHFCRDLAALAREDRLYRTPCRDWEFGEIAFATACKMRNSVVLTGDNGAEIYRIVRGLAGAIADRRAPGHLDRVRLLALDNSIAVGTKYRGQFEERLKMVIEGVKSDPSILLYVHSLPDLVDWEANARGAFFCPAMQEGMARVLTGALPGEMAYCRKVNPGLVDCFRQVPVQALDREGVLRGLYALRDDFGAYHGVAYSESALVAIVDAADAGDAAGFWQRALDLLDEAGARKKLAGDANAVSVDDIDQITEGKGGKGDAPEEAV